MSEHAVILAVSDAADGNRRQAEALAAAIAHRIDADTDHVIVQPRAPWSWLAPRCLPLAHRAFADDVQAVLAKPPLLAVGCGRQAALATRLLRAAGSRAVQILDPRIDPDHYDAVVTPEHDALRGTKVINTLGSLHAVDDRWLAAAAQEFSELAVLPQPRVVLALGGPTRTWPLDTKAFSRLADALDALLDRSGGSLLLTTSRRSPAWLRALAQQRFAARAAVLWLGESPVSRRNPYPGFLAHADVIIATPDSANLLSEAAATGAPLLCPPWPAQSGKLAQLVNRLRQRQLLEDMPDAAAIRSDRFDPGALLRRRPNPLRETAAVADALVRRLRLDQSAVGE